MTTEQQQFLEKKVAEQMLQALIKKHNLTFMAATHPALINEIITMMINFKNNDYKQA